MNILKKIKKKICPSKSREQIIEEYRKKGVKIGNHCNICSNIASGNEPYLIEIGNNVVISYNVDFVTHDASFCALNGEWYNDLYGKITVGDNTFIGSGSTIMYGVTIGEKCIIASHSVVTKSIPSGYVAGGYLLKLFVRRRNLLKKTKIKLLIPTSYHMMKKRSYFFQVN